MKNIDTGIYQPNPPRKCGRKLPDATYGEGGDFSLDGALSPWTWMLGDGLEKYISLSDGDVPPRLPVSINPIMSIMTLGFVPGYGPDIEMPQDAQQEYERLSYALKTPGIADQVGDNHYSAFEFFEETVLYGPSRRIPKRLAKTLSRTIADHGPIPMIFVHRKIPVFQNEKQRDIATIERGMGLYDWTRQADDMIPTWEKEGWGMYARRNQDAGHAHYMARILWVIDEIKNNWESHKDEENWRHAKDFFGKLRYVKQTFGASWLCKISYTLPLDGDPDEEMLELPGINLIDLNEEEE